MSLTDKSRIEINPLRDFRYIADGNYVPSATRYACGSICFCIPRQRREMSKARGIYLISNWCSQSERQYIELERSESISSQRRGPQNEVWVLGFTSEVDISTKEKREQEYKEKILIFLLSFCLYKGLGLAHIYIWAVKCDARTFVKVKILR